MVINIKQKVAFSKGNFKIEEYNNILQFYCASDILTCTPALVLVVGALDEI